MPVHKITGSSRRYFMARARTLAVIICRNHTKASLAQIGRECGGRHYTTILNAERQGRALLPYEPLKTHYANVSQRLGTG